MVLVAFSDIWALIEANCLEHGPGSRDFWQIRPLHQERGQTLYSMAPLQICLLNR
jgi:hypothetical protein